MRICAGTEIRRRIDRRAQIAHLEMHVRAGALSCRAHGANLRALRHALACLEEVGTPLDFPVMTPRGESTVGRGLQESLRQFSLNQPAIGVDIHLPMINYTEMMEIL